MFALWLETREGVSIQKRLKKIFFNAERVASFEYLHICSQGTRNTHTDMWQCSLLACSYVVECVASWFAYKMC